MNKGHQTYLIRWALDQLVPVPVSEAHIKPDDVPWSRVFRLAVDHLREAVYLCYAVEMAMESSMVYESFGQCQQERMSTFITKQICGRDTLGIYLRRCDERKREALTDADFNLLATRTAWANRLADQFEAAGL